MKKVALLIGEMEHRLAWLKNQPDEGAESRAREIEHWLPEFKALFVSPPPGANHP